ncbi:MAG: RodZ domain-containing protein [Burkholderiaceae bacterium]
MSETQLNEQSGVTQPEQISVMTQAVLGPGAQLAAHRQAKGLTVEQVANQLNLAPRQIQALEADNYAALPGVVIARGFIRAYAKLLKVDPTPLVSLMQGDVAPMESLQLKRALSGSFSESRLPSTASSGLLSKWVMASALLVLIIVGGFAAYWFGLIPGFSESVSGNIEKGTTFLSSPANGTSSDHANAMTDNAAPKPPVSAYEVPSSSRVTNDEITAPITAAVPTTAAIATSTIASVPTTTVQASVVAKVPTTISPPTQQTPAPINIRPVAPATAAPSNTSAAPVTLAPVPSPAAKAIVSANQDSLAAANKNMLAIKAREESWVEIKDANDRILISRLMTAGSTETLSVANPVSLTIGNASGVDVTLRGKSVDLQSTAKSNVARLNLK